VDEGLQHCGLVKEAAYTFLARRQSRGWRVLDAVREPDKRTITRRQPRDRQDTMRWIKTRCVPSPLGQVYLRVLRPRSASRRRKIESRSVSEVRRIDERLQRAIYEPQAKKYRNVKEISVKNLKPFLLRKKLQQIVVDAFIQIQYSFCISNSLFILHIVFLSLSLSLSLYNVLTYYWTANIFFRHVCRILSKVSAKPIRRIMKNE